MMEYLLLVPIYGNHIMFAHDLCLSQIEYFRNVIDLIKTEILVLWARSEMIVSAIGPICSWFSAGGGSGFLPEADQ
jgi:hypothetical protein